MESSFHVLTLSPEERRAGKWQRGRVRRGLGWGHCSSDDGMKNTRRKRRGERGRERITESLEQA